MIKVRLIYLIDFFSDISSLDDSDLIIDFPDVHVANVNTLSLLFITLQDVVDQVQILDIKKAYGPDGISPVMLKLGGEPLCHLLQRLYNESLTKYCFPQVWKCANVVPIFKKRCDYRCFKLQADFSSQYFKQNL